MEKIKNIKATAARVGKNVLTKAGSVASNVKNRLQKESEK